MEKFNIAKAGRHDFWDVYNLYKYLMGTEPLFSEAEYNLYVKDNQKNIAIVRDSENKAVGLIAWIVWPGALSFPLDVCFIQDMVVDRQMRKQGLGSFMLEHVKGWAAQKAIHILHLQTDDAKNIEFYKRNGFESRNTGLFCFLQS